MRKILIGAALGALGYFAYDHSRQQSTLPHAESVEAVASASQFHCDGRTRCSQMTSCEEATYFLRNCPGVKMDGEGDGVPCEKQWCGSNGLSE